MINQQDTTHNILEARAIMRIAQFNDDELRALVQLVEQEESISKIIKRAEMYKMMRESIKYIAGWLTVVIGGFVLGKDTVVGVFRGLIS